MTAQPASSTTTLLPGNTLFDPEIYFARIGYQGDRTASLQTLRQIHYLHPQVISFENLNPFLGLPVRLDKESLQQKLVVEGRGGYCYEHNSLLSHALTALGFDVKGLAARVLWNLPEGVTNPRTHMLLLVTVEGKLYIADVGFGGLTLTAPLALEPDVEQTTSQGVFRLLKTGDEFLLETQIRGGWQPMYRFGMDQQLLPDYEMASWFLCNNPASRFTKEIMAARMTPSCRYALRNNELAVHYTNGETERKVLTHANDVMDTLETVFLIKLPQPTALQTALEGLLHRLSQPVQ